MRPSQAGGRGNPISLLYSTQHIIFPTYTSLHKNASIYQKLLDGHMNKLGYLGADPIAVRRRQTRSGDRSQALPGNVFLAALPPVQFVVQQGRNNAPVLAISKRS